MFLEEFPITFPPTYPYEENLQSPTSYMTTRCPAWCDRVLLSPEARSILNTDTSPLYGVIGDNVCMGDHKVRLHNNQVYQIKGNVVTFCQRTVLFLISL